MENKSEDLILEMLYFFVNEAKDDLEKNGYVVKSDSVVFDDYNSPVITYDGATEFKNPLIIDLYDKFYSPYGEIPAYEKLFSHVLNSEAPEEFARRFSHFFTSQTKEATTYHLTTFYFSILQEYCDNVNVENFVFDSIKYDYLNDIYNKYINFLEEPSVPVKIIIPLTGLLWANHGSLDTDFEAKIEDDITLRNMTVDEQRGRLFTLIRQDEFHFDGRNTGIDTITNMVIEINAKLRLKDKRLVDTFSRIETIFKEKFEKINTLLSLVSMEYMSRLVGFSKVYYKVEGHLFNANTTPMSYWHDLHVPQNYLPRFVDIDKGFFERSDYTTLNTERINSIIAVYSKIYNSKPTHSRKIEGALFRRTRALMDSNETEGLLDSVIGIEQILNDGKGDISYKISLYMANLMYGDELFESQSKKEIFEEFKSIYSKRSGVVHRGEKESDKKSLVYLERLILKILNHSEIDLNSEEIITEQIENIYLFKD